LVQKPFSSQLLELLLLQSPQRLARLAERWGAPSAEPAAIYRHMIADREQLERLVLDAEWVGTTQSVLVDVMQDFGLPVSLYREDRTAQRELADCGLIYPYPEEWGVDEASQRPWTMPVELAVMCARVVPIYRARLPLLLGHLDDDRLAFIGDNLGVKLASTHPERVLQLCRHLMRSEHLEQFLLAPEWYDHIFTLQIVFEWHGICHRQELFSFAGGDDTLRPLTPPEPCAEPRLTASPFVDPDGQSHAATQWQAAATCDDFSAPVIERLRQDRNEWGGQDLQAGDDLTDEVFSELTPSATLCWRLRYRDASLAWSDWSTPLLVPVAACAR